MDNYSAWNSISSGYTRTQVRLSDAKKPQFYCKAVSIWHPAPGLHPVVPLLTIRLSMSRKENSQTSMLVRLA